MPGAAKRRLIPALGPEGAAELHRQMTRRITREAALAALGPVELWCTPGIDHRLFLCLAREYGVKRYPQRGDDLGMRMHFALAEALTRCTRALLVGSDCPSLGRRDLADAARALDTHEVVLGAAADGGYVLIGSRAARAALFTGIRWGSDQVLGATRARLKALGLSYVEQGPFRDIDRPEDLAHLPPGFGLRWRQSVNGAPGDV